MPNRRQRRCHDKQGRRTRKLWFESVEPRTLLAAQPIITEFMANNADNIGLGNVDRDFGKPNPFGDGSSPDWVEINNAGDEIVNLQGYSLTDDSDELTKWTFPSVELDAGEYVIVYASGSENSFDDVGRIHANFRLSSGGEYLALTSPAGAVISEVVPAGHEYPIQDANVSYGLSSTEGLVSPTSEVQYWVPEHGRLDAVWQRPDFDATANGFSNGRAAIGYETRLTSSTSFAPYFTTELPVDTQSVYVRSEFTLDEVDQIAHLLLQLKFDNGVVVYLNGTEVMRENAPVKVNWTSTASSRSRRDSAARSFEGFNLTDSRSLLQVGSNVLAVHLLNHSSDASDFLLSMKLLANGPSNAGKPGYLLASTPGSANDAVERLAGPSIRDVTRNPGALTDNEDLLITAHVSAHLAPVDTVNLHYRIMFADEVILRMVDDGSGHDAVAGDGIYSAVIPATASGPGEMIRWRVKTTDTAANSMRWPLFVHETDSEQYLGTMVTDPSIQSQIPVLHWFIDDTNFRRAGTAIGGRGSLFYLDQFYDNIRADDHGQTTRSFPKKSYDLDFNQDRRFRWKDGERRVGDINLITNWGDKAKFRHALAYDMYRDAGSPAFFAFPVRVQKNGVFFSTADLIEDADARTLERLGLNPDGALYKMYDGLNSSSHSAWEKKTRRWEDKSDLSELQQATLLEGNAWVQFAFDQLDIPEFINFLPLFDLQNNKGCCHKNYYFYRDTGATDEWQIIIWDPDLAFGHDFKSGAGYFDDVMDWDNPLFSTRAPTTNALLRKLYTARETPGFHEMYLRRLRTIMDEFLQPSDTPYTDRYLERRMDEYVAMMDPHDDPFDPTPSPPEWPKATHGVVRGTDDADLDYNTWGSWSHGNGSRLFADRGETMREHAQRIKDEYLPQRRDFLYGHPELPPAQIGNPDLEFGWIEVRPKTGNHLEQFVELNNPHGTSVDISGWQFTGSTEFTFPPGTVIPSNWSLIVAADKTAFRARTDGPSGVQGRFLVGGWDGHLAVGETLSLVGADGQLVRSTLISNEPIVGDVNGDEIFDSADLVAVASAGEYNDQVPRNSTWFEGDWNRDGEFDSQDIVFAFIFGNFQTAAAVPSWENTRQLDNQCVSPRQSEHVPPTETVRLLTSDAWQDSDIRERLVTRLRQNRLS